MSNPEEKILAFLKEIKANQKKLKARVSVVLKKLEEYLLVSKPVLDENTIRLLLLGDHEKEKDLKGTSL